MPNAALTRNALWRTDEPFEVKPYSMIEDTMINTVWAVVHEGRIEPLQKITAPEGTRVLVTLLLEDEADFWQDASASSLDEVWDNAEDDRYAELLEA